MNVNNLGIVFTVTEEQSHIAKLKYLKHVDVNDNFQRNSGKYMFNHTFVKPNAGLISGLQIL